MSEKMRNLLSGVAILAVSIYWFIAARGFKELSRLYPQVIAVIVGLLALVLLGMTLLGRGPKIALAGGDAGERHLRSGTMIGAMVLWTALIPVVGLLIASIVGVTAMGLITFRAHVGTVRAIIIAVLLVFVFFLLFRFLLNVPFPTGIL